MRIDAFAGSDAAVLQQLLRSMQEQGVEPGLSAEQLEGLFSRGGWLAYQEGQCVAGAALALADAAVEADLVWLTLPDARDDLRDALLQAVRVNGLAIGASSMLCYLSEDDHANLEFLDSCGAVTVPGYMRWVAELRHQIDTELPDDLVIRAVDDVELLLSVTRLAWGDLPGHKPATAESTRVALDAFGNGSHFVLMDGSGEPLGLVRGLLTDPDTAYVDAPGLAPGWRSSRNYGILARYAMNHFFELGARSAILDSWGDPPAATEGLRAAGWTQNVVMPGRRIPITNRR